ncbi:MAG TPA: PIN domain-containing protein [Chloroflexota bacterium]|nr:PIN domain-containing protein [Chloroflexota bacterium]HUM69240.1 PIN domain-containing protein [Chloroflexota bacterium]
MPIRVYLDTSAYNRPFDDQYQPRIWLETLAVSVILQMFETNAATLLASTVVEYETSRNPHQLRQEWVNKVLVLADGIQIIDGSIKQRALELEQNGLKAIDALHVSCAEKANADYFVTCDDRLIRRYQKMKEQLLTVCNPVEFVRATTGEP